MKNQFLPIQKKSLAAKAPTKNSLPTALRYFMVAAVMLVLQLNASKAATYFLTAAGASSAQTLTSWNTVAGGGGSSPANFTTTNDIFIIPVGISGVLGTSITIGTNSTTSAILQIAGTLTINNGVTLSIAGRNTVDNCIVTGTIIFAGNTARLDIVNNNVNANFVLASGATLITANTTGILGTSCSITKSANGVVTFDAASNLELNGVAQATLGIPTTVNNLTLSGSGAKTISTAITINGNLTLSGTATFAAPASQNVGGILTIGNGTTFTAPTAMNVTGNFINNGTFNSNSGTVTMNGTTQTISGTAQTTFNNLTITSGTSTTVVSTSSIRLTGTLTTNNKFILASDASGTASIGSSTGATITGNVTVQRFVPGGRRAFRFFAHPFSSATAISNMMGSTGIIITGSGAGMDASANNNPSAFSFSEAAYDGSNNSGWTGFAATSETIAVGAGIRALHRGARSQLPAATQVNPPTPQAATIAWSGTMTTGSKVFSMLNNGGPEAGWNLIGNPYASAVNIGQIASGNRNNIATGSAWNPNLATAGAYETITFGSDYILPSGGAFFINTPSAANFTFSESNKSTATPASLFKNDEFLQNALEIKLWSDSSIHWDNFVLRNRNTLTDAFEYTADGLKMKNSNVNIYTLSSDNKKLSIDNRPLDESKEVKLVFETSSPYHFTFKVSHIQMSGLEVYLEDKFENKEVLLTANTAYDFVTTADAASQGTDRFTLKFKNAPTTPVTELSTAKNAFTLYPNPANSTIHLSLANPAGTHTYAIYNHLGMLVQSGELNYDNQRSHAIQIEMLTSGIYFVKLDGGQVIRFAK